MGQKRSAKGITGHFLFTRDEPPIFRIYDIKYPEGFKDYTCYHHDPTVTISDDDVVLDDENETMDYSPETLGE